MASDEVDISGLDKVELLKLLWEAMKPAAFFAMSGRPPPPFDNENATAAVAKYIDYYAGRCIKTDLSGDKASARSYNRDAGADAFQRIVAKMRAT
jgi:hypothetical protein